MVAEIAWASCNVSCLLAYKALSKSCTFFLLLVFGWTPHTFKCVRNTFCDRTSIMVLKQCKVSCSSASKKASERRVYRRSFAVFVCYMTITLEGAVGSRGGSWRCYGGSRNGQWASISTDLYPWQLKRCKALEKANRRSVTQWRK